MKLLTLAYMGPSSLIFFLLLSVMSLGLAADSARPLAVRESSVVLYSHQDEDSLQLAILHKDEPLTLLAEALGNQRWYMVRTQHGLIGWLRASDVTLSETARRVLTEEILSTSTWSAQASGGSLYQGTWSVESNVSAKSAAGAWTLQDPGGKTVLVGTWSAEKFSTGWNGAWRASSKGSKLEYGGSWSAVLQHASELPLSDLFKAAALSAVRGVWTGGYRSGTWAIRTIQ
jgi:hypothetical protein